MKQKNKPVFFVLLIFLVFPTVSSWAASRGSSSGGLEVGAGLNAFTGGRTVPSLEISYAGSDQSVAWASTGVRNNYYYQSSHLLFYFRNWSAGTMWGGDITSGFGGGAGYSVRGFQDENSTSETKKEDFLLGPAIRLNWSYGPVYLNLSTVFGLRDLTKHIAGLNFQNVESITFGIRF